jgi:tRNA dimethylallyltransferase
VVLAGPTAAGKTGASLSVAGDCFEIISADSVQVYRHLDIGSSKPSIHDREHIRHYLIDWVEPDFSFTAGEFCREARKAAEEISAHGRIPMIVGGTGLYIDSYFQGLSGIPEIPEKIKRSLRDELNDRGLEALYNELILVDPGFGIRLHPNDTQRVLRGLEVYRGTGRPLSSFFSSRMPYGSKSVLYIGLYEERDIMRKRIEERVDRMISIGMVDEVRALRRMGFGPGLRSMSSIGYAEINRYLDGKMQMDEAVEKIKIATKNYAKRQVTWFRKNERFFWIKSGETLKIKELLRRWLDEGSDKDRSLQQG